MIDKEKIKYLFSGITGFIVDVVVLILVTEFVFHDSQGPKILGLIYTAKIISSVIGQSASFTLNRYWTFQSTGERILRQASKMLLIYLLNILIAALLYTLYFDLLSIVSNTQNDGDELMIFIANFLTSATQMVINFFFYKYFVFKKSKF
ncbi:GtrA family protein [Candidatus Dojkabacteria bacterium]|uniref:GtrA family protein n=1 Tax=Candidatus Dojkabacteria bacterium TaxID=2099670 RepID=A0A955L1M5_9BACT|nr:GtrA family protein [Candidatus Dojkabacteria bacterium]